MRHDRLIAVVHSIVWCNSSMAQRFQHVGLIGKYQAQGIRASLEAAANLLRDAGLSVSIETQTAQNTGLTNFPTRSMHQIGCDCDLAVVMGGDGTMLHAARELASQHVPLIGINMGRLGFITDIPLTEMTVGLHDMIRGDYEEEHRSVLQGQVLRDGESIFAGDALNDVVVSRGSKNSMVEVRVTVQEQFVTNMRADGVILASPTGSTAYALSTGGPIVHPSIGGWILVPIAPHTLSNRPIVLPDTGSVWFDIVEGRDLSVSFDSQTLATVKPGDRVVVRKSLDHVRFLHPRSWSYYATLRRKLHWNDGGEE